MTRRTLSLWLFSWTIVALGIGPCGPIAGGALRGPEHTDTVSDWSFANAVPRCAVEVAGPHSVTVNCMSWQQRLFVSCSVCEGKRWSGLALEQSSGRIQIGEAIYPVELRRVTSADELDAVWRARAKKLENDDPDPRPEGWWTFELTSRETGPAA
ncbi:MAG: hypothetical protein AAF430_18160 [Myxococcota bacterium]